LGGCWGDVSFLTPSFSSAVRADFRSGDGDRPWFSLPLPSWRRTGTRCEDSSLFFPSSSHVEAILMIFLLALPPFSETMEDFFFFSSSQHQRNFSVPLFFFSFPCAVKEGRYAFPPSLQFSAGKALLFFLLPPSLPLSLLHY